MNRRDVASFRRGESGEVAEQHVRPCIRRSRLVYWISIAPAEHRCCKRIERFVVLAWRHEPVAYSAKAYTVGLAFALEPAAE
jgi:hypothetical protein